MKTFSILKTFYIFALSNNHKQSQTIKNIKNHEEKMDMCNLRFCLRG